MSKPIYMSLMYGFNAPKPNCYRCGDCCMMIPVEITQQEKDLIASRLKSKERELFLQSITTDCLAAQMLPNQLVVPLTAGIGWMKASCIFLGWEEHKGKHRARCRIYKIRPQRCRTFHCGKERKDDHLNALRFIYRVEGEEQIAEAKKIVAQHCRGKEYHGK